MTRLAVCISHPIQYYAPWFRFITAQAKIELKVFYLWDFGVTDKVDEGFGQIVRWDTPLLSGYEYEFVENVSRVPATSRFFGLRNPNLKRRIETWKPDAVLMIGYNYASMMRFIMTWDTRRAPLLFRGDSHRLVEQNGVTARARRLYISSLFRRFSALLYVGSANLAYLRYHHVAPHKLFRSPHAVDNDFFQANDAEQERAAAKWRAELNIEPQQRVVMFAGKFEEKKRPLDLWRAFESYDAANEAKNATLLFVGAGELKVELRREVGNHPRVRFAPFQNQTLMPRTYRAADLFVLPSHSANETWGLAINEAMNCGRAVTVSSLVGCAADLVRPYQNGLRFPAGDVAALTACLREALKDENRLRAWGKESRNIIADFNYAAATRGVYEALDYLRSPATREQADRS